MSLVAHFKSWPTCWIGTPYVIGQYAGCNNPNHQNAIIPSVGGKIKLLQIRIFLQCRRPWFNSWIGKISWKRDRLSSLVFLGFPCGLAGKESACSAGGLGLIPGLGRSPGEGKGYPLQYSGLENSMGCIVHGAAKNWTQLSNYHFHFSNISLESNSSNQWMYHPTSLKRLSRHD